MPREWDCRGLVQYLAEAKAHGLTFDWAWSLAIKRYPPRGSDLIVPPADTTSPALQLFDEQGQKQESIFEAMRRFCEDAWNGDRPKLAGFSLDMFRVAVDERSSAAHNGDFRLAA